MDAFASNPYMFTGKNNLILLVIFSVFFTGLFFAGSVSVSGKEKRADIRSDERNISASFSGRIVASVNGIRGKHAVGTLRENDLLMKAAQMKADDMAKKGYFSHDTPEGHDPWYWFEKAGFSFSRAGENLALNFDDPKDVTEAWMDSPAHRKNILNGEYSETGVGIATGKYKGEEATFIVELYAKPKAERHEFAVADIFNNLPTAFRKVLMEI